MLEIILDLEHNAYKEMLLSTPKNPCLCKIGELFEIEFLDLDPICRGKVFNYDLDDITQRIPGRAGGKYFYYQYALISLLHKEENIYFINECELFISGEGWLPLIKNFNYVDIVISKEPDWLQ